MVSSILSLMGAGNTGFDTAESATFLARTSGLDATHTAAYKALINRLVWQGLWSGLDILYVMSTQDSTTAGLNLISTSYTLTPTTSPTFTADQGYAGNGTTSYLATGYNPGDGGGSYQFTQNNASLGIWTRTLNSAGTLAGLGPLTTASPTRVGNNTSSHTGGAAINSSSATTDAAGEATGLLVGNRTASNAVQIYLNGSSIKTGSTASAAVTNEAWGISKVGGLFVSSQYSIAFAGRSFSANEQVNLYQIFQQWQTAVGA